MGGGNPAYNSLYVLYILLIREVDDMSIENIIGSIIYSVIYAYSLIKRINITNNLISGMYYSIEQMWNEYMSDIEAKESIDLICVFDEIIHVENNDQLYRDITTVIISYFENGNIIDGDTVIMEIYQKGYVQGMVLTYNQISKIIEFYINQ